MMRRIRTDGWKALPLVAVAAGALLWHVLACVESPMSFAPNGDLAFVTMEPYSDEDLALRGAHVYRLMVLPAGANEPKVLETSSDWMISSPAFSPDGRRIAYLRIPLLTAEDLSRMEALVKVTGKTSTQPASRQIDFQWPGLDALFKPSTPLPDTTPTAAAPATGGEKQDLVLPAMEPTLMFRNVVEFGPLVPGQLVERNAVNGRILSVSKVELVLPALGDEAAEGIGSALLIGYVAGHLQYSPDGRWVCFCPGSGAPGTVAWALDPATKDVRILAAPVVAAALSPDGKILAILQQGALGFARMDGSVTSYIRWETEVSLAGLVWANKDTVAILGREKVDGQDVHRLCFVKVDGTLLNTVALPEMKVGDYADTGQLARSGDGKYIVVSFNEATYFLTPAGKLLIAREGNDQEGYLAQPTFSRDSKQVAFKVMKPRGDKTSRAAEIAFFTPAGQELRRVSMPPADVPQTQPAKP